MKNILIETRRILENPENWTKLCSSRNSQGIPVPYYDPSATKFCLVGAIAKANLNLNKEYSPVTILVDFLEKSLILSYREPFVSRFNDNPNTTHQDVLNLIDKTLEIL